MWYFVESRQPYSWSEATRLPSAAAGRFIGKRIIFDKQSSVELASTPVHQGSIGRRLYQFILCDKTIGTAPRIFRKYNNNKYYYLLIVINWCTLHHLSYQGRSRYHFDSDSVEPPHPPPPWLPPIYRLEAYRTRCQCVDYISPMPISPAQIWFIVDSTENAVRRESKI